MRFPEPLNEVQHRIIVAQGKGPLAPAVKFFLACIAVDPFGHADHRDVLYTVLVHDLGHGTDLSGTTVNQQKVRPQPFIAIRVFFEQT